MPGRKRFSKFDNMPFSLLRREYESGNKIYCVRFKNEDGTYMIARSTGLSNKDAAIKWAFEQIHQGKIVTKRNIKFRNYTDGFFDEDSEWVEYRRKRGLSAGYTHNKHRNSYIKNYLAPHFGDRRLTSIKTLDIEKWQDDMLFDTELSATTVNHMLMCLRVIFKWALKHNYVLSNPCEQVPKLKQDSKERGIPTIDEVIKLFRDKSIWRDERHYLMAKLSMLTGMRQGEIIGLKRKYVSDCMIQVVLAWEAGKGLKDPKTAKSKRPVLFPSSFSDELRAFMLDAPFQDGEDFVFYTHIKGKPITNDKGINDSTYKALAKIGVSEEDRKDRHIVFHSLRHFFTTYLEKKGVPTRTIMDFLGHTNAAMTEHYTHRDLQEIFKDILPLQEQLLIP
jgi:integrase